MNSLSPSLELSPELAEGFWHLTWSEYRPRCYSAKRLQNSKCKHTKTLSPWRCAISDNEFDLNALTARQRAPLD